MTEVPTPPKPPTPKAAAKGIGGKLKNQPKWVWVLGLTVLAGVAFLAYRKANSPSEETLPEDDYDGATFDTEATDFGYPAPTQGAYGGGSSLDSGGYGPGQGLLPDPVGPLSPDGQGLAPVINLYGAGVTPSDVTVADGAEAPAPSLAQVIQRTTGGGLPSRIDAAHQTPPKPVVKNGKFYHVYNYGKKNEKWVYVRPASQPSAVRPKSTPVVKKPPPAPAAVKKTAPTGGGSSGGTAAPAAPKNVVKNGKFYHVYDYGTSRERWVYVRPAA